jgi:hypothetical protein
MSGVPDPAIALQIGRSLASPDEFGALGLLSSRTLAAVYALFKLRLEIRRHLRVGAPDLVLMPYGYC